MKTLRQAFALLLLVAAFVFAANNTALVTLSLWPFAFSMTAPLFAVLVLGFFAGFAVSALFRILRALPAFMDRRALEKELASVKADRDNLQRSLDALKAEREGRAAASPEEADGGCAGGA